MTPESLKGIVEFIKVVAWPLAFVLAILIFRKPLTHFLNELAPRITKVSAFEVSIELATVPSPPVPWADPTLFEGPNLTGGDPTTTTIMELFERIYEDTVWHYLIVDIGTGRSWLTSRLFLFTVLAVSFRFEVRRLCRDQGRGPRSAILGARKSGKDPFGLGGGVPGARACAGKGMGGSGPLAARRSNLEGEG